MSPRVLLEVPITFDVGSELIHAPMIEVEVGGTPTKLIVDTGSTDHVLTMELAERAGLETSPGESWTDSVGASVPSWTLGEVPIRIGALDIRLQHVVAIAGPEPFEGWGVGGFLSPQHVHPNAWVVIDLVDGALTFVGGAEADVQGWLADRFPGLQMLSLERESGDSTVLVRAAIVPFDPVVTMLDTGGKRTEFAEAAVPTLLGGQRPSPAAVLGARQPSAQRSTIRCFGWAPLHCRSPACWCGRRSVQLRVWSAWTCSGGRCSSRAPIPAAP